MLWDAAAALCALSIDGQSLAAYIALCDFEQDNNTRYALTEKGAARP